MTIENHIENLKKLKSFHNGSYGADIDRAIKALEQEPCEDAISRQAVLNILDDMTKDYAKSNDFEKVNGVAWVKVQKLPPIKPQKPKTGHWIKDDITERSKSAYKHKCDRCGAYHRAMYDYCPSCGARMVKPQESGDNE